MKDQQERRAKNHVYRKLVLAILECPVQNEEEEETLVEPKPETTQPDTIYPLNSITKSKLSDMMRFKGSIRGSPITIFVDCGSATNVLNPYVARRLGLTIQPIQSAKLRSASGHDINPTWEAIDVTVEIQTYSFTD